MQDNFIKKVLVYGDSNTWGYISGTFNRETFYCERYPFDIRWTGILQRYLGEEYKIIEEGLPGRTIATDVPLMPGMNGMQYLLPCLYSQRPFDLIIIMLGLNDLNPVYKLTAKKIAQHMEAMCDLVRSNHAGPHGKIPQILIIAPPLIKNSQLSEEFRSIYAGADKNSNQLASCYAKLANKESYFFCNASYIPFSSQSDGLHLDPNGHQELAEIIYQYLREKGL